MSRPQEDSMCKEKKSRAPPVERCFLRGPNWTIGDYTNVADPDPSIIKQRYQEKPRFLMFFDLF
jgi:hypothetical protein